MGWAVFERVKNEFRNARFRLLGGVVESVAQTMLAAASNAEPESALQAICTSTARSVGCDRSSIFLLDNGRFRGRYNYGNPPAVAARFNSHLVALDDPLVVAASKSNSVITVNDVSRSQLVHRRTAEIAGIRAIAVALIYERVENKVIGFMTIEFNERRGRITPLFARLLQTSTNIVEIVLANERAASARRELELRLGELENVEAIARMCGGIAHDVNNALTVILGNAELLARSMAPGVEQRTAYEQLTVAVSHATTLTRNLLAFGQLAMGRPVVIDVNEQIRRMEPLLRSYTAQLQLDLCLGASRAWIEIDPAQLEQLLINLVVNAADALGETGRIEIGTADGDESGTFELWVADNGPGFRHDGFARALEPFFTTKDVGGHSGIGLATVQAIVRSAHGRLLHREDRPGAHIEMVLPRSDVAPAPPSQPAAVSAPEFEWSSMRVLVVDDHPAVLAVASRAMRRRGCEVRTAEGGEMALALVRDDPDVDLLITDIMMPGMNGGELARRVRELAPFVRVVYMSGFADPTILDDTLSDEQAALVFKPFTADQLLMRAYQTLTG